MEQALGCDLFVRTPQGVSLSLAGKVFMPRAERLLEAYEGTLAFLAERRSSERRVLQLAADDSLTPVVLDALRANLLLTQADTELRLSSMGSGDVLARIKNSEAEIGFCGHVHGISDFRRLPVLEAQLGIIVPPGCQIPDSLQTLEDLNDVPFIRLADCTPVTQIMKLHEIRFRPYFNSPIVFTCLSAAFDLMRDQKISAIATALDASLPQARDMRFVPLAGLLPVLRAYLVMPKKPDQDAYQDQMIQTVKRSIHQSRWHTSVKLLNKQ